MTSFANGLLRFRRERRRFFDAAAQLLEEVLAGEVLVELDHPHRRPLAAIKDAVAELRVGREEDDAVAADEGLHRRGAERDEPRWRRVRGRASQRAPDARFAPDALRLEPHP